MYMYYLLGFKFFGDFDSMEKLYNEQGASENQSNFRGFGNLLKNIDSSLRIKVKLSLK